ncbi:MAG TPA: hypothetical protein VFS43_38860 [Polyangiaceae bacterium]|nr:hypothetical protein [Polyangiaceae bacterium]
MWVRRAAIRPVPSYAKVAAPDVERVEDSLSNDDPESEERLAQAMGRFEATQPALSLHVATALGRPLDETALALGYFLSIAVWMTFEASFGARLGEVHESDLEASSQALALDEELRRDAPDEAVDTDDVVAMEQPAMVEFVREHVEVALEAHADEVELDDVDSIYRLILLEIVSLSYAVRPPERFPANKAEWVA